MGHEFRRLIGMLASHNPGLLPSDSKNDSSRLSFWFFPLGKPAKDKRIVIWFSDGVSSVTDNVF
jgi:hypothetical protein